MWVVRRRDLCEGHGAAAEVVLVVVPAASLGAVPGGRLRTYRRPDRRAPCRGPHADRAPAPGLAWPHVLGELAQQLEDGRIYDRDLTALVGALNAVQEAYIRRSSFRGLTGR